MEWHQGHLESKAHQQQSHPDQRRALDAPLQRGQLPDRLIVGASGAAVNQGNSVKQNRRGKRAEQEIFQGGFVGADIAALESRKDIGCDGENFDSEKSEDEVAARGHQRHAGAGEQQQSIVFPAVDGFPLVEFHRDECGNAGDDQKKPLEENAEIVDDQASRAEWCADGCSTGSSGCRRPTAVARTAMRPMRPLRSGAVKGSSSMSAIPATIRMICGMRRIRSLFIISLVRRQAGAAASVPRDSRPQGCAHSLFSAEPAEAKLPCGAGRAPNKHRSTASPE